MQCHEVDYQIYGEDMQFVEIELDQGETVIAEAGAMMYMDGDVGFEAKMGDGSAASEGVFSKMLGAGKRLIAGESLFMTHFTQKGRGKGHAAFGAPYPGKVLAVDMSEHPGGLLCQRDAFLCAALGTQISIAFTKRFSAGIFGGEGFILQKLLGDGMAFIHAGGGVVHKKLNNQKLKIDTGCIVAFSPEIDYSIERAGGLKSMFLGGEGLFLATLQGTGDVWVQSLPFSRLADRILRNASFMKSGKGESKTFNPLES